MEINQFSLSIFGLGPESPNPAGSLYIFDISDFFNYLCFLFLDILYIISIITAMVEIEAKINEIKPIKFHSSYFESTIFNSLSNFLISFSS